MEVFKIKKRMLRAFCSPFVTLLIVVTGVAFADQPVPAVPETQTITTGTTYIADGLIMETDALAWTLSNKSITAIPPLATGQQVIHHYL